MNSQLQQFAQNLKALREERGLSKQQLAERAGVPLYMITTCENGRDYHKPENLIKLARFFHVTTDMLLLGE